MRLDKPDRKVATGALGIGGAVGVVLAWTLTEFFGVNVPEPVAAAFGSICSFVAAYLVPEA